MFAKIDDPGPAHMHTRGDGCWKVSESQDCWTGFLGKGRVNEWSPVSAFICCSISWGSDSSSSSLSGWTGFGYRKSDNTCSQLYPMVEKNCPPMLTSTVYRTKSRCWEANSHTGVRHIISSRNTYFLHVQICYITRQELVRLRRSRNPRTLISENGSCFICSWPVSVLEHVAMTPHLRMMTTNQVAQSSPCLSGI